jgi:hypothetical protein
MQALMAQMQENTIAQSSQVIQENQQPNVEQVIPPAPATVHINVPQPEPVYLPPIAAPQVHTPPLVTSGQLVNQTEQLEYILNKLNTLEGSQGMIDPAEFCIVTDLEIPKDFKVPDFPKYDGTSDPKVHVYMYTSRMGAYLRNDKMMMYYFQESLKDSAIRWYLNLDKKEIRTWHDLANAFVRHYKHNIGCAPDKSSLRKLKMNKGEDFRTFALRWRNQAAQVEPPMTEKDLIDSFMEIEDLNRQYKVACAMATDFAHLLSTGSRIEAALRSSSDVSEGSRKKKEGGIQHIIANTASPSQFAQSPYRAPYRGNYQPQNRPQMYYPSPASAPPVYIQTPQQRPPVQRRNPPAPQYPPLPVSQAEIYKQLVAGGMLGPVPTQPWNPPYPTWYNPSVKCAYHSDVTGHSTEECIRLRQKIYELINAGSIKLNPVEQESAKPNDQAKVNNVTAEDSVNFIEEDNEQYAEVNGLFKLEICQPGEQKREVIIPSSANPLIISAPKKPELAFQVPTTVHQIQTLSTSEVVITYFTGI